MTAPVFLIGGGRDADGVAAAHAPFLAAAGASAGAGGRADAAPAPVLCVMLEEDGLDVARWTDDNLAGAAAVRALVVSERRPLRQDDLDGVAALYVAGGWTPGYAAACCATALDVRVPYAGFSAGAAIAARGALVGGWRLGGREVAQQDAGEELDQVAVRPGLGLVPFAVDVHATQWGTLTRLAAAVDAGLVPEGLAIDEHTCVEVRGGAVAAVHGCGVAYRVRPGTLDLLR